MCVCGGGLVVSLFGLFGFGFGGLFVWIFFNIIQLTETDHHLTSHPKPQMPEEFREEPGAHSRCSP